MCATSHRELTGYGGRAARWAGTWYWRGTGHGGVAPGHAAGEPLRVALLSWRCDQSRPSRDGPTGSLPDCRFTF